MEFIFTFSLFGLCMAIMAIGLFFKRKPLAKDCGLDPVTGDRVTDCACAAEGKPQCLKKKVFNFFSNEESSDREQPGDRANTLKFPKDTP